MELPQYQDISSKSALVANDLMMASGVETAQDKMFSKFIFLLYVASITCELLAAYIITK